MTLHQKNRPVSINGHAKMRHCLHNNFFDGTRTLLIVQLYSINSFGSFDQHYQLQFVNQTINFKNESIYDFIINNNHLRRCG